ncbi:PucR family transcriptional regulator [Actinokineospora sp.]|uniref:PucR family transcriptional regulator n=1 Tax=Actinokineospora sp. TaxID=1872133 RepID=UPI0040378B96
MTLAFDRKYDHRVAALVAEVVRGLDQLIDVTYNKILDEMSMYEAGSLVPHARLRDSVAANLRSMLAALSGPGLSDLEPPRQTGRERALQGAPLPEVLRAYRIGFTEVWNRLVELAVRQDREVLTSVISAATTIWYLFDEYTEALTSGYRETSAELTLAQQNQRSVLVEALFAGRTGGTLWDIARLLDLPLDGTFVVVAAETPGLGQEPLPQIEARLRSDNHASAWRLTPDLQLGVVSLREPGAVGLVLKTLGAHVSARVGVSPMFTGLGNTARALHFARVALSSLPMGTAEAVQFDHSPLAGLVAGSPEASAQLAHQVLRPLLDLSADERDVLLSTLRVWFDNHGSTRLTAERMYCHANTIRHRLRRVSEELGRSLSDPADIAEIGTALRALLMFPDTAHLPPPRHPLSRP